MGRAAENIRERHIPESVVVQIPGRGSALLAVIQMPFPADKVPVSPVTVIPTLWPGWTWRDCAATATANATRDAKRRGDRKAGAILMTVASMAHRLWEGSLVLWQIIRNSWSRIKRQENIESEVRRVLNTARSEAMFAC
jgi:hypothetical protein